MAAFLSGLLPCGTTTVAGMPVDMPAKAMPWPWLPREPQITPFRGGPITYIRSVGAAPLKAKLELLASRYGSRFTPRPGWDALT